jgi:hypothetical protein
MSKIDVVKILAAESLYNKRKWKNGRDIGGDNREIVSKALDAYFILNGIKRNEFSSRDYLGEMYIFKQKSFAFAQEDNTCFF